jgi:hypothetical protein
MKFEVLTAIARRLSIGPDPSPIFLLSDWLPSLSLRSSYPIQALYFPALSLVLKMEPVCFLETLA